MDKSFNDQELSDIMKEIEALEEEFAGDTEDQKIEASAVMQELAELEEEVSIPVAQKATPKVLNFEKKTYGEEKKTAPTTMSFKVQGDLNLELQFDIGGKTVALEVTQTGLTIQMEGGVTFTVPVSDAQSLKKAV